MKNSQRSKNSKLLKEFIVYCENHPEERFWQALGNWTNSRIFMAELNSPDEAVDTFYFVGKTK